MTTERLFRNFIYFKIGEILKKYKVDSAKITKIQDEIFKEIRDIL